MSIPLFLGLCGYFFCPEVPNVFSLFHSLFIYFFKNQFNAASQLPQAELANPSWVFFNILYSSLGQLSSYWMLVISFCVCLLDYELHESAMPLFILVSLQANCYNSQYMFGKLMGEWRDEQMLTFSCLALWCNTGSGVWLMQGMALSLRGNFKYKE